MRRPLSLLVSVPLIVAASTAQAVCYVNGSASGFNNGTSWINAYTNLQATLVNSSCTELWVAKGVYKPTPVVNPNSVTDTERSVFFKVLPGVKVYGGFNGTETLRTQRNPNPATNGTVLSGDIDSNDAHAATTNIDVTSADIVGSNSYHVVFMDGTTSAGVITTETVLDGFTITGGNANNGGHGHPFDDSGGLYCNGDGAGHECSPTLSNLIFSGNLAAFGGALYVDGASGGASNPTLTNVVFTGNNGTTNGGAVFNWGFANGTSLPTFTNVTFSNNTSPLGGAIFNDAHSFGIASPTFVGATFSGNTATWGAALYNYADTGGISSPTFASSTFSANIVTINGGALYNGAGTNGVSSPQFSDVHFSGNQAGWGGAIYDDGRSGVSQSQLTNVTFDSNSAVNDGGALLSNTGGGGTGNATFEHVVFNANTAAFGGAIFLESESGGVTNPNLTDVTFSNNHASSDGGALFGQGPNGTCKPVFGNVTFSANRADGNRGGAPDGGGAIFDDACSPVLVNVTFTGNSAGAEGGGAILNFDAGNGGTSNPILSNVILWGDTVTSGSGAEILNVASTGSAAPAIDHSVLQGGCIAGDGNVCTSVLTTDPALGPLQDNGGFNDTMLLGASSSAIDAASDAACAAAPVGGIDQRGLARPQGAHCDIGAVEMREYQLSVNVSGNGSVSSSPASFAPGAISNCTNACSGNFPESGFVTLIATPVFGTHVTWGGDCASDGTVTMNANRTCSAEFDIDTHAITVVIGGLQGTGLALHLSYDGGSEDSSPIGIGSTGFAFASHVPYGANYAVSVATQPAGPAQICTIANASGTMPDSDVTNIVVSCTSAYTIGGSVSGLSGSGLMLQLNGGNDLAVNGSSFTFATPLFNGNSYVVRIIAQPTGQTCTLSNASGTVTNANVGNIAVNCIGAQAQLTLTIDDGSAFAHYGQIVDYLVTLTNNGNATASNIAVGSTFSAGLDGVNTQWQCIAGGDDVVCVPHGVGNLIDTVSLPAGRSATWIVSVPVIDATSDDTVELSVNATNAAGASDTDTLVIFRDGFNVPYGNGTDVVQAAQNDVVFALPPTRENRIDTLTIMHLGSTDIIAERLALDAGDFVRLRANTHGREDRATLWAGVTAGSKLVLGVAEGGHVALLEGAVQPLELTLDWN